MSPDTDLSSDDTLVAGIAAGREDAFTSLFRRYHANVYRFALHMTGSTAAAEDVTQDVFLVVMREAGRYQTGKPTASPWLYGIARNCARQRLQRDRRLEQLAADREDPGESEPIIEPDPVGDLVRAERLDALRRALLALPVRYREIVVMCDLQELSYVEAAGALGCAVGTVRSRLHRARGLLTRKILALESSARASPRHQAADDERIEAPHGIARARKRCMT